MDNYLILLIVNTPGGTMEFLIVVVIVGFIIVMFGGAVGGAALFAKDEKRQAGHEQQAAQTADELFNGDPQVVYKAPDSSGGISLDTLIAQANQHGYRFVAESGRMATRRVVFEKGTAADDA